MSEAPTRGRTRPLRILLLCLATLATTLGLAGGAVPGTTQTASAAGSCTSTIYWNSGLEKSFYLGSEVCMDYSSIGGNRRVIWQRDGNLVAYNMTLGWVNSKATWATNTSGRGYVLKFQADGNMVIYDSHGFALWSSQTFTSARPRSYMFEFVPGAKSVRVTHRTASALVGSEVRRWCVTNGAYNC